ncbi:MAG: VOC family protein [Acidimicrobiales bacterium]|nr:VOC family protein [Acidimicrobiales bacterium]
MSIHHLQIWVPDLPRAVESWGWLLEELGYEPGRTWDHGRVWRSNGTGIVIEASPDMVPGMLYSRLRPGMNHVAFQVESADRIGELHAAAPDHGWRSLSSDADSRHPLPAALTVAYLEDRDGFEVELVAPAHDLVAPAG